VKANLWQSDCCRALTRATNLPDLKPEAPKADPETQMQNEMPPTTALTATTTSIKTNKSTDKRDRQGQHGVPGDRTGEEKGIRSSTTETACLLSSRYTAPGGEQGLLRVDAEDLFCPLDGQRACFQFN